MTVRGPIKINPTHLRTAIRICSSQKTAKAIASLRVLRALSQSPRATAAMIAAQSRASRSQVFNLAQRVNAKEFERLWRYGSTAKQRVDLDRSPLTPKVLSGLKRRLAFERDRLGLAPNRRRVVGADGKSKRRPHPALRIEVVIELRTTQKSIVSIAKQLQCTPRDVRDWGILYQTKGLIGLCDERTGRRPKMRPASGTNQSARTIRPEVSQLPPSPPQTLVRRDTVETRLTTLLKSVWEEQNPDMNRRHVLLHGLRGVGKTAVARNLFAGEAAYFDCEDAAVRRRLMSPEATFANVDQRIVVLDEIGKLRNPYHALAATLGAPIIKRVLAITSAPLQPQPIGDVIYPEPSLMHRIMMLPLLWEERRAFVEQRHTATPFEQALVASGLPELTSPRQPNVEMYRRWARSVFEPDLKHLCPCRSSQFIQLIESLMAQSGSEFTPQAIATQCGLSRDSMQQCVRVLTDVGIVSMVSFFETTTDANARVYATDTGFVHAVQSTKIIRADAQRHHENLWRHLVLLQLRQEMEQPDRVRTWRSVHGDCVDFVFESGKNEWVAIQCDWFDSGNIDGLKAFRRIRPGGKNLVVSPRLTTERRLDDSFEYSVCQPMFMAGLLRNGFNSMEAYRRKLRLILTNTESESSTPAPR